MDNASVSGAEDPGSIPGGTTTPKNHSTYMKNRKNSHMLKIVVFLHSNQLSAFRHQKVGQIGD